MLSVLQAEERQGHGTGNARSVRRDHKVPGVIYGNHKPSTNIQIDYKELDQYLNKPGFYTHLFDLKMGKKSEQVIVKDVQFDPVTDHPLHIDLLRVSSESRLTVSVPVVFINEALAPGLKKGGVLNIVLHEIEVLCSPTNIPENITVDLTGAEIHHAFHFQDIVLPVGVEPAHRTADQTVATIAAPTVQTAEETSASTEGSAGSATATPAK